VSDAGQWAISGGMVLLWVNIVSLSDNAIIVGFRPLGGRLRAFFGAVFGGWPSKRAETGCFEGLESPNIAELREFRQRIGVLGGGWKP